MPHDVTGAALVRPTSYWMPRHAVESAWTEHAPFAAWIIDVARPALAVELGTHNGFSLFAFSEAARRLGISTQFAAVDTWEGDDQAGFYGENVYQSVREIADREYRGSISLHRTTFAEAVESFADGSIDLLHIDGRHGYEDVRSDFETYLPKLSNRAVVLFHDTHEFQEGFGVHRYWDELRVTAPSFEFHHGHGLGVLAVGSEAPEGVLDFIAAATEEPEIARALYAELGLNVAAFEEIERRRVENLALHARIADLEQTVTKLKASTSWRVTRPLRSLSDLRRRVTSRREAATPSQQHPAT
jgi:hypothetical protein